jgi:uncharacterized membrane protein YphA (DoxX/SURF4 family)
MFLAFIIRVFLGLVFLSSALGKLRKHHQFVEAIQDYRLLPESLARIYALWLPWVELLVGLMFLSGLGLRFATIVAFLLLVSFFIAIVPNLRADRTPRKCNCYGIFGDTDISWGIVARNIVLVILTIMLFGISRNNLSWGSWLNDWQSDYLLLLSIDSLVLISLLLIFGFIALILIERALSLGRRWS